jgi:hypothetical protein
VINIEQSSFNLFKLSEKYWIITHGSYFCVQKQLFMAVINYFEQLYYSGTVPINDYKLRSLINCQIHNYRILFQEIREICFL